MEGLLFKDWDEGGIRQRVYAVMMTNILELALPRPGGAGLRYHGTVQVPRCTQPELVLGS